MSHEPGAISSSLPYPQVLVRNQLFELDSGDSTPLRAELYPEGSAESPDGSSRERLSLARALWHGQVVGKCRIQRLLGRGGMGAVYLGHHDDLGIEVAVKTIERGRSRSARQRFLRESRLAARLRHPNVVAVLDAGFDQGMGLPYAVQEYLPGGSLKDRLAQGDMDRDAILGVCREIAQALEAAHREGIVHRDVKPANILFDAQGTAKLADFGLAKQPAAGDSQLTGTGMYLGTPAYMSPEQVDDAKNAGPRSDLYGLGSTLYHMLMGRPPFRASDGLALLGRILREEPEDPRKARPEVPEDLARLCLRLLSKRPEDRFASATELLRALKELGSEPASGNGSPETLAGALETTDSTEGPRAKRNGRALPRLALGLAAAGVALGIAWASGLFARGDAPPAQAVTQEAELPGPAEATGNDEGLCQLFPSLARDLVLALSFDGGTPGRALGERNRTAGQDREPNGRLGRGLRLSSASPSLRLPPIASTGVTLAFWMRHDAALAPSPPLTWIELAAADPLWRTSRNHFAICSRAPGRSPNFGLWHEGSAMLEVDFGGIWVLLRCDGLFDGWHHVVLSFELGATSSRLIGLLDGQPWDMAGFSAARGPEAIVTSHTAVLPWNVCPRWDAGLCVGASSKGAADQGSQAGGSIDELAVWRRPLRIEEMRTLYELGRRGYSACDGLARAARKIGTGS